MGKNLIANALFKAGAKIEIHDDHFSPDEHDVNWLRVVGRRGWIVLTKDTRIRYHKLEKSSLIEAGVAAFILTSGGLKGSEMAEIFVKALPAILRTLKNFPKPLIARITRNSKLTVIEN